MRITQALLLLSLCALAGCRVGPFHESKLPSDSGTFTLAQGKEDAERRIHYHVAPSRDEAPAIHRVSTRALEVARLDVKVVSIDKQLALKLNVEPWRGVCVRVPPGHSPAPEGGFQADDVLLSINGIELASAEQLKGVVESVLPPGKPATVRLLRRDEGREFREVSLEVSPTTKQIDETTTDRIPLEAPAEITRRTGLQIATVPANLSREIWATEGTRALVTSVVSGSPGYEGGLRGGDIVTGCNGQPVSDAAAIEAALRSGAEELLLEVDGPLGTHRATLRPIKDVDQRSRVRIPILIDYYSRVDRSTTSFLDFIFQFGFNYRRTSEPSTTREPNESTELSILPLGMFEFERSPEENKTTIFWFITWTSKS